MTHTDCEIVSAQFRAVKNIISGQRLLNKTPSVTCDLFLSGGFEKSSESSIEVEGDVGTAVKIWGWDYHPCSKHCVFVCQRLILSLTSHLCILSRHPALSALGTQIHSVRSAESSSGCMCFICVTQRLDLDSQDCGLYIYLESSARLPQKALRATSNLTKR